MDYNCLPVLSHLLDIYSPTLFDMDLIVYSLRIPSIHQPAKVHIDEDYDTDKWDTIVTTIFPMPSLLCALFPFIIVIFSHCTLVLH